MVYVGSGDYNIYALDALTGDEIWSFETMDWITNTPTLSDDKLVVASMDGRATIYDTDTGKRRFASRAINRSVVGSPIIVEDSIYVAYRDGRLISLNLNEEEFPLAQKWYTLKTQLYVWALMGHPGMPKGFNWSTWLRQTIETTPATDGETLYITSQEGRLIAIDRHTGEKRWVYKTDGKSLSTPTIVDDLILAGRPRRSPPRRRFLHGRGAMDAARRRPQHLHAGGRGRRPLPGLQGRHALRPGVRP